MKSGEEASVRMTPIKEVNKHHNKLKKDKDVKDIESEHKELKEAMSRLNSLK